MNQDFHFSNSKLDKVMSSEQYHQIVAAILSGKYSWACILILRFAGYNPLHYIPYRTYERLIKDNRSSVSSSELQKHNRDQEEETSAVESFRSSLQRGSGQIDNLA